VEENRKCACAQRECEEGNAFANSPTFLLPTDGRPKRRACCLFAWREDGLVSIRVCVSVRVCGRKGASWKKRQCAERRQIVLAAPTPRPPLPFRIVCHPFSPKHLATPLAMIHQHRDWQKARLAGTASGASQVPNFPVPHPYSVGERSDDSSWTGPSQLAATLHRSINGESRESHR